MKQMEYLKQLLSVETDECQIWPFSKRGSDYGQIAIGDGNGKADYAHRVAFRLAHGPIPEGKCVLHRCDTPTCINPRHLWAGTHKENMADAALKGRMHGPGRAVAGSSNGRAVLSESEVMRILKHHADGMSERKIAAKFEVARTTVQKIVRGENWKHLPRIETKKESQCQ